MALIINNEEIRNAAMALEAASAVNTELGDRLRAAIANEIKEARNRLVSGIHFDNGDPRGARHSIRRVIYQKILGGNINILDGKNSGSTTSYEPPRKLRPGQRGGNRRPYVAERNRLDKYYGSDRGFVLRFLNSGTVERETRYGGRGSIRQTGWFGHTAPWQMENAAEMVAEKVNEYIRKQAGQ